MAGTTIPGDLARALFPKARRAVLGLLYGRPGESFYLREVVRLTGLGLGQVQRELEHLVGAGLVRRSPRGRHVYFEANTDCPIHDELRGIVTKTIGAGEVLREALQPLRARVDLALLHGSAARGEEGPESDLDLIVVGQATFAELVGAIRSAEQQLHRQINPTVYSRADFMARLGEGSHFLRTVLDRPKLFLVGGADELAELAR